MRAVTLLPVLGLAACGLLSESSVQVPIDFSVVGQHGTVIVPSAQVTAVAEGIRILGQIGTSTPCYSLSSSAALRESTITVRVVAEAYPGTGACVQVVGAFHYTALLHPAALGSYRVIVEHVGRNGAVTVANTLVQLH